MQSAVILYEKGSESAMRRVSEAGILTETMYIALRGNDLVIDSTP